MAKVWCREGERTGKKIEKRTTIGFPSAHGTGATTRTPTMTDEMMKAIAPDVITTSHWVRIFVNGLLNAGTFNTGFHRVIQPSLTCFTLIFRFSFAPEAVWRGCDDRGRCRM